MGGRAVAKFRKQFSKKQWKKCCGGHCKKCDIYNAYLDEYGAKSGKKRFDKDHDKMH
jgi:maltose-binding protein MalE